MVCDDARSMNGGHVLRQLFFLTALLNGVKYDSDAADGDGSTDSGSGGGGRRRHMGTPAEATSARSRHPVKVVTHPLSKVVTSASNDISHTL